MLDASPERIALLTKEGCANALTMQVRLEAALKTLDMPEHYLVLDVRALDRGDVRTAYGTPTVLVDGQDLFGEPLPAASAHPT